MQCGDLLSFKCNVLIFSVYSLLGRDIALIMVQICRKEFILLLLLSFSPPPLQVILWYRPKGGAFSPPCGCPCVSISKSCVSISTVPRGRGGCGAGILPPPPYGCPCISTILKGGGRGHSFPPPTGALVVPSQGGSILPPPPCGCPCVSTVPKG